MRHGRLWRRRRLRAQTAQRTALRSEPVRTIALNLDMREYGQIDLRISLNGNTVNVHLKADRQETADALARDDASLRDALHHAGYEAGQVQVDKRDAGGPRLGDAAASGQQSGGAGTGASSGHMASDQRAAVAAAAGTARQRCLRPSRAGYPRCPSPGSLSRP